MPKLGDLSIKRKLALVSFVTSSATLLLAGSAFALYEIRSYRETLAQQLSTQADIVGYNVTPALVFKDERAAADTLAALRAEPQIAFAAVYTPDGKVFGKYLRPGAGDDSGFAPPDLTTERAGFDARTFRLTRRLGTPERPLGVVYLRADLTGLSERGLRYAGISGAVLGMSLLASMAIASVLQKQVSEPVLDLVNTARTVAFERNYAVRAAARSRDELGVLVSAFNEMLDEIQRRDRELRTVNRELGQRTQELGRKSEEVEAFVYIVSHDLRGPLVTLQGFSRELERSCKDLSERLEGAPLPAATERAVREILDSDLPESLRFISASTSKFERLISALLELSRTGRRELKTERVDINALVAETLDSLKLAIERSGAEIIVAPLPPALGDATALGQVFTNLISNSLRYLQGGRAGRIEIGGETRDGVNQYFVRDNGVGIPEAAQRKLFQVFQRFHPELSEGEGIGLAMVKRIVERHDGRIWAESVEGAGTTFRFTLREGVQGAERER